MDKDELENQNPTDNLDTQVNDQATEQNDQGTTQPTEDDRTPSERVSAFLDTITDADPNAKPETQKVEDEDESEEQDGQPTASKQPDPTKSKPSTENGQKTPEQEEEELLATVKSARGQERIKEVFAQKKQLEADINEFRDMVKSTGMTPQDFAQTLEFGRLMSSGNEQDLRVALQMAEKVRADIAAKLGVEAPGVDLLAEHPDLKAAVDNMEITKEHAHELAKHRRAINEQQKRQQTVQQSQQQNQEFVKTVESAAQTMEAYLKTREKEVDHPVRMKKLVEHFQNPANLQSFVQTYQPNQWVATIKMMYDGIVVPRTPTNQQPLRSRSISQGRPTPTAEAPIDRIAQHIDNMGI